MASSWNTCGRMAMDAAVRSSCHLGELSLGSPATGEWIIDDIGKVRNGRWGAGRGAMEKGGEERGETREVMR